MPDTHVVAICGSLRDRSHTRQSLRLVLRGAGEVGATGELLDLREYELPPYDADIGSQGDSDALTEAVERADSVVLGTPMYHGSYSGVLKNALDYCGFDEFENTTVGLLAVAGGSFPVTALEHLRSVCRALDAWVIPHQVAIPRASAAFDGDELRDEDLSRRVRVLGHRAVQFAGIEPDPMTFESDQNVGGE
jgi:NAD(P)H-dependent FMN reductase